MYEAMTGLGLLAAPAQAPFELTGRVSGIRVVILGAGLAGMTAAYELGKVGYDCRVLEARARPGGRVLTVRRGTVSEEEGPGQTAGFDDDLYFNDALAVLRQPDGRVHFAGDYMTDMSSWMQGAFESGRDVASAIHRRALARV